MPTTNWSDHTEDLPAEVNGVITITTAGQLAKLAEIVNSGTSYEGKTIKLGNDIYLSGHLWTAISGMTRTVNGTTETIIFKGTFDGDGHKISGLTINATTNYQGLFGYVDGGTIKNVNLTGVNVTSTKSSVGGLVGCVYNGGIENCTVSGKVEGTVNSNQCRYIGGLVGKVSNATVKNNLVFDATVSGKYDLIGAVIGYLDNNSTVTNNLYYSITDDRKGVGNSSTGSVDNGTAQAYKLTLPEGVKVMDGGVNVGNDWYVAQGATINLTATADNQGLQSITIGDANLTSSTGIISYTVNSNATGSLLHSATRPQQISPPKTTRQFLWLAGLPKLLTLPTASRAFQSAVASTWTTELFSPSQLRALKISTAALLHITQTTAQFQSADLPRKLSASGVAQVVP